MTLERIKNIHFLLREENLEALIVEAPLDLFYLTGFNLSAGKLILSQKESVLFVDGRYFEACRHHPDISVKLSNGFQAQSPFHTYLNTIHGRIGFDSQATSYAGFQELCKMVSSSHLSPLPGPIRKIRQIKQSHELELLHSSAQLNAAGLGHILSLLEEGISEKQLAQDLEIYWKREGGEGCAFQPIIAFGENSALPHYRAGDRTLKRGDLILLDIGVIKHHYHSDMTRTFAWKHCDPLFSSIYKIVYQAVQAALAYCHPGALIKDVDAAARSIIQDAGYGERFIHSLGHGLGLETHELPVIKSDLPYGNIALRPGMVITIEPGIYLPRQGGIRLEETVLITTQGYSLLSSPSLPQELIIM